MNENTTFLIEKKALIIQLDPAIIKTGNNGFEITGSNIATWQKLLEDFLDANYDIFIISPAAKSKNYFLSELQKSSAHIEDKLKFIKPNFIPYKSLQNHDIILCHTDLEKITLKLKSTVSCKSLSVVSTADDASHIDKLKTLLSHREINTALRSLLQRIETDNREIMRKTGEISEQIENLYIARALAVNQQKSITLLQDFLSASTTPTCLQLLEISQAICEVNSIFNKFPYLKNIDELIDKAMAKAVKQQYVLLSEINYYAAPALPASVATSEDFFEKIACKIATLRKAKKILSKNYASLLKDLENTYLQVINAFIDALEKKSAYLNEFTSIEEAAILIKILNFFKENNFISPAKKYSVKSLISSLELKKIDERTPKNFQEAEKRRKILGHLLNLSNEPNAKQLCEKLKAMKNQEAEKKFSHAEAFNLLRSAYESLILIYLEIKDLGPKGKKIWADYRKKNKAYPYEKILITHLRNLNYSVICARPVPEDKEDLLSAASVVFEEISQNKRKIHWMKNGSGSICQKLIEDDIGFFLFIDTAESFYADFTEKFLVQCTSNDLSLKELKKIKELLSCFGHVISKPKQIEPLQKNIEARIEQINHIIKNLGVEAVADDIQKLPSADKKDATDYKSLLQKKLDKLKTKIKFYSRNYPFVYKNDKIKSNDTFAELTLRVSILNSKIKIVQRMPLIKEISKSIYQEFQQILGEEGVKKLLPELIQHDDTLITNTLNLSTKEFQAQFPGNAEHDVLTYLKDSLENYRKNCYQQISANLTRSIFHILTSEEQIKTSAIFKNAKIEANTDGFVYFTFDASQDYTPFQNAMRIQRDNNNTTFSAAVTITSADKKNTAVFKVAIDKFWLAYAIHQIKLWEKEIPVFSASSRFSVMLHKPSQAENPHQEKINFLKALKAELTKSNWLDISSFDISSLEKIKSVYLSFLEKNADCKLFLESLICSSKVLSNAPQEFQQSLKNISFGNQQAERKLEFGSL